MQHAGQNPVTHHTTPSHRDWVTIDYKHTSKSIHSTPDRSAETYPTTLSHRDWDLPVHTYWSTWVGYEPMTLRIETNSPTTWPVVSIIGLIEVHHLLIHSLYSGSFLSLWLLCHVMTYETIACWNVMNDLKSGLATLYEACIKLAVWLHVVIDGVACAWFFEQTTFSHQIEVSSQILMTDSTSSRK